ncbi:response regulator [Cryomorpha ignava]|uniref:Response regulator n=1 Tax=Cryomorpha ignava TaxID=101383 RepID=A0A7K3WVH0_9FLAO|nr:response regulator [Cryomorpha ignava]NEN25667.1 response regulator [Cryomorpha ignava]
MYDNKGKREEEESKMRSAILYIDDEEHNLVAFKAVLRRDFEIYTAISVKEARKYMEDHEIKIIVSDQRMPQTTGVQFFSEIKNSHPEPIRILLTGYSDMEAVIDSINKGEVYRYLTKPWDSDYMKSILHQAMELFDLRRENKKLISDLKKANEQLEFYLRQKLLS